LLRYIGSKCFDSDAHIVNFGEKRYFEKLVAGLVEITDWMKELRHSKRIKNYKIMCPNRLLKMGEDNDKVAKRVRTYWDADPVHIFTDGYQQLTRNLLDKVAVAAEKAAELKEQQRPAQSGSRANTGRPGWTDDAVARRANTSQSTRGARGHFHHWRDGRGRAPHRGGRHGGRFRGGPRFGPY
jgi:hypothetical protein